MTFNRREFLAMAAVLGANAAWGRGLGSPSSVAWQERRDVYPEGVASGDPDSNSVLLWTRRAPGTSPVDELTVELALDESFRKVIAKRTAKISQAADWTCRVLVGGLHPRQVYWYRFTDKHGFGSRIGRTTTAPTDDDPRPVRFAFVSCQNANMGAQNAYRRMIYEDERAAEADQLGFVLHLGDFIYELVWYPEDRPTYYDRKVVDIVRYPKGEKVHDFHIPVDVDDYRAIYRNYLHDPDLQDARARFPFVPMWDNHEFSWQGFQSFEVFDGKVRPSATRKVAAMQALFEYQPARMAKPSGPSLERFDPPAVADVAVTKFDDHGLGQEPNNLTAINSLRGYRTLRWGRHVALIITDERSYRSEDPGTDVDGDAITIKDFAAFIPEEVLQIIDGGREYNGGQPPDMITVGDKKTANTQKDRPPQTILGAEQKKWFLDQLRESKATWKIWGSTTATLAERVDPQNLPSDFAPTKWPAEFASLGGGDMSCAYYELGQIYDFVRQQNITGFATVAGDRHAFWAGLAAKSLPPKPFEPVGVAFVTGSISAPGFLESLEHGVKKDSRMRPLVLAQAPGDTKPQPTINMLLRHGVRSCLEYSRSGDLAKARALSNPNMSPHLSFVDVGGHGYAVVQAAANELLTEFVCIQRPVTRSESPDGGPILYRARNRSRLWRAGETPKIESTVVEGEARFSV